jgi:hypothetical protein
MWEKRGKGLSVFDIQARLRLESFMPGGRRRGGKVARWWSRHNLVKCFQRGRWEDSGDGIHGRWYPKRSADEIACIYYEHFDRWPEDFHWAQPLIKRAFLYHFPGPEGNAFRHMVWPPPLHREFGK